MIPNTTWNSIKTDDVLDYTNNWFVTFAGANIKTSAEYRIKAKAMIASAAAPANSNSMPDIILSNDMLENNWRTATFTLNIVTIPSDDIVHFHLFNGINFGENIPYKDRLKPGPAQSLNSKNIGPIVLYDDFSAKVVGEQLTEISQKGFQVQMSNEEFIKFTTGSGLEIKSELGSVGVDLLEPKNLLFNSSQSYHNPIIGFNTVATQSLVPSTLTLQGQSPLPAS